jgi:ribosomal protein S12 methylthiotransferase accessory factor YcaO
MYCEAVSRRPDSGHWVHRRRAAWFSAAAWIGLTVSACAALPGASATLSRPLLGLTSSSSGVCQAIAALPDVSAAQRAFTNVAHDALHGLAADPRLNRAMSAQVLEAMQSVEVDFTQPSDDALSEDLTNLLAVTDAALGALGERVPACAK